jgi:hypothetical protein
MLTKVSGILSCAYAVALMVQWMIQGAKGVLLCVLSCAEVLAVACRLCMMLLAAVLLLAECAVLVRCTHENNAQGDNTTSVISCMVAVLVSPGINQG